MITLKMDVGGVTRSLQLLADSLKQANIKKPLQEISKAKQEEVRQRFQQGGPGWEPLAPESLMQRVRVERERLARTQETAIFKIGKRLSSQLKQAMARNARTGKVKASTLAKRRLEIDVFKKLRAGEALSGDAEDRAMRRLYKRTLERQKGIINRRNAGPLGRIANSIKAEIRGDRLTLFSEVKWSGVHNDGGTAGKGAQIPKRTFLEWTAEDLETARDAFERHMIKAVIG